MELLTYKWLSPVASSLKELSGTSKFNSFPWGGGRVEMNIDEYKQQQSKS